MLTDKAQQCFTWFQNHAGHRKRAKEHHRRSWHWRAVVRAERKEELERLIRKNSGARPGSKAYFSKYQKSLSEMCAKLTEEERQHYEELAEDWSKRGPPEDVKRKYVSSPFVGDIIRLMANPRMAETKSGELLSRLSKQMFRDYGVRMFVLYGYKDTRDQTCVAK